MQRKAMTAIEPMTQAQANALVSVLAEIRPGDWKQPQLLKLLWEHRADHPFPTLTLAAVKAATNPAVKSPDVIFMPGSHWDAPTVAGQKLRAPDCPDHIGKEAPNCAGCWADVKAGDRPRSHIGKHWQPANIADQLEAIHEAAPEEAASLIQEDS
jgi:hypothetical protein